MPTKTDRILSYLPQTFKTSPRPAVLYPVADAFGNELLLGENCLAAIMLAHWVDFADKNALQINDLGKMAALYGLVPWLDESGNSLETVEEFREHLKRYVRTFIEGTVTVQGILRITAEALALRIADAPDQMDRWWVRGEGKDSVVTVETLGHDALTVLNFESRVASGSPALPARIAGTIDLSAGVNLQGTNILRLKIDGTPEEIDLTEGITPGEPLSLDQIVEIINKAPRPTIASRHGPHLELASPSTGPNSKLEIINGVHDAAPSLLGLASRSYHGAEATAAEYVGTVDLSTPTDLTNQRYLRLEINGTHLEEIDCAGADAANTTLEQIRNKINNAFPGLSVANDDGKHLILTSPTKGDASRISVQALSSQNAAPKILGVVSILVAGQNAKPARADSTRDLRGRVDLSERTNIRLQIDGGTPVNINCAGLEPNKTERVEIVAAINQALGYAAATITERGISVQSSSTGPASEIVFEQPAKDDATYDIFGIGPLIFRGSGAKVARLTAAPLLSDNGVDLRANYFLLLAVDGGPPIELDFRQAAGGYSELMALPLNKLAEHINNVFVGAQIASTDGEHLFLTSTKSGGVSKLEVLTRETIRKRRFVTRAFVTDEAATEVFGFVAKDAQGTSAVGARLEGTTDLSLSADLTETRFLRLKVDGFPAVEIDCAGGRPRATTLAEVVSKINKDLKTHGLAEAATDDGKHLILTSPSVGAGSLIAIDPPRVALDTLLGIEPGTFRGAEATSARFLGTVDLTGGIDLPAEATIKLGIDDTAPVEIVIGEAAPIHRSTSQIVAAINAALKSAVAKTDGRRIELRSTKKGVESKITFEVPAAHDVTNEIFGIVVPRAYHGDAARPARVIGLRDLSAARDLSAFRFLRIALDGAPSQTIDCAAKAAYPEAATLAEIVNSIGPEIASASPTGQLILTSPGAGPTAQITLATFDDGNAAKALFGNSPLAASGEPALPAVITGDKNLLLPVDLSRRSVLKIAVDGGPPVNIAVAGTVPAKTALDEIIARINSVIPNLAGANADNHLQLTSPGTGLGSTLSLQALRFLEVIEYPRRPATPLSLLSKHNGFWDVVNGGVADSYAEITITASQGTVGPSLVNFGLGWSIHLFVVLERGETARLFRDPLRGLQAEVINASGATHAIAGSQILVGPIGAQAWVPFEGICTLTGSPQPSLQLNNPQAPAIALLKSLQPGTEVTVDVLESDISSLPPVVIENDGEEVRLVGRVKPYDDGFGLVDGDETPIAELLPGPRIDLLAYMDEVVRVEGPVHAGTPPLMIVERITSLFDVMLYSAPKGGTPVHEPYLGVSIGVGTTDADSLVGRINGFSGDESKLVRGEELDKAVVLSVPQGKTRFRYLDCLGSRFDRAWFDRSHFPNGFCGERGVFDVSRFSNSPPEKLRAVFASSKPFSEPPVRIEFRWDTFSAGAFVVNLPADLPPRFGGRFDEARFGQEKNSPKVHQGAVAEPVSDPKFLVKLINGESGDPPSVFVKATLVGSVELGWTPADMPFRKPQFLTLGEPGRAARLYLSEDGLTGFIKLEAKMDGTWGNEIAISARRAGPAIYDVTVFYRGACFEQARSIVLGATKETISEFLRPGPTGVLQAKAAGVRADVTRERADNSQLIVST